MSQPWQSDYDLCSQQNSPGDNALGVQIRFDLWWWAAQRPDWVSKDGAEQVPWIASSNGGNTTDISFGGVNMVEKWMDLGFILKNKDDKYVLVQTNPSGSKLV
jgi:hypothetical protein